MNERTTWILSWNYNVFVVAFGVVAATNSIQPPKPSGPVPSEPQLRWHDLEFYGIIHFGLGTFTDREWGFGDESPALRNRTEFDATQIAGLVRQAGTKGLVLVCKHHDGFCLWPSCYTEQSPWRNGQGTSRGRCRMLAGNRASSSACSGPRRSS